jgi:hypothetical protein
MLKGWQEAQTPLDSLFRQRIMPTPHAVEGGYNTVLQLIVTLIALCISIY